MGEPAYKRVWGSALFQSDKKHIYPLNTKETWDYLWWVTSHLRGTRTISRFVLKKIHWGPKHNRSRSDAIVINMNFNSYSSLVIILFFIIPVVFYFFFLFNGSLRPRKSKIKKKYQFNLFSFILCICSLHFYEYDEPDHLVAANIQVYKINTTSNSQGVFDPSRYFYFYHNDYSNNPVKYSICIIM